MMAKKIIIGLAGRAGSGKTTASKHLVQELGFFRMSFADPIKNMIGDFLLSMGYGPDYVDALLTTEKEQVLAPIKKSTRHLLQSIGTEWGRGCVDKNVWTILARRRLHVEEAERIIFDDVRFENEASMIRSLGGIIIHIDRGDLVSDDQHSSEAGIMDGDNDFFVDNDTTIDDFCGDVGMIARGRLGA